jgi:tetraacyldisaccharide 4'-kinase
VLQANRFRMKKVLRLLLFPLAFLYILATEIRHFFFAAGILKSRSFKTPVITVGNLSTGGTGKSPMVDYLLKLLAQKYHAASLSRGYGRTTKGYVEVTSGIGVVQVGDEPLMLKMSNPAVPMAVDENRVEGITTLLKEHQGLNCVVLDDAFQHRYVKAGLNILLTTYQEPFYKDFVLPAGNLRELRKNAARAHIVVVTKCPAMDAVQMKTMRFKIGRYTRAHVFFAGIEYGRPCSLEGNAQIDLKDHSVLLVTGIARPEPLLAHCRKMALKMEHLAYPDHYSYKAADFKDIAQKFDSFAAENKVILTTHKDAVKWQAVAGHLPQALPVFYQPIRQVLLKDAEGFQALIENYVESNQPNR